MPQRISWKKGMRLTDSLLRRSDELTFQYVKHAIQLSAGGRFGLLPCEHPFEGFIELSGGYVDVKSLRCLAVTRCGDFIEIDIDTRYTNTLDTRVKIPEDTGHEEFLLTVCVDESRWHETEESVEEPTYSFLLLSKDTPVPDNGLPIARIVKKYDWMLDESDFLPPCLYVNSHPQMYDLYLQVLDTLSGIDMKILQLGKESWKDVIRVFWPLEQQIRISVDKERDTLTPMQLLEYVQQTVSAFVTACQLTKKLVLTNAETLRNYVVSPYDYKNMYPKIREGLKHCLSIKDNIDSLDDNSSEPEKPEPKSKVEAPEAPTIASEHLTQLVKTKTVRIPIKNIAAGAKVYFTVDGTEPTTSSKSGTVISLSTDFNNKREAEPDKVYQVKVKAVVNGVSSKTNSYTVTVIKDWTKWTGISI